MNRRLFLAALAGLSGSAFTGGRPSFAQDGESSASPGADGASGGEAGKGVAFSFERVVEQARALANEAYAPAAQPLKAPWANLGYDDYRSIRYRSDAQVWRDESRHFTLDLLHPGFRYVAPVEIFVVDKGMALEIPFDPALFNYPDHLSAPDNPDDLTFSGFRVRYPLNRFDYQDEFLVFQGASYFRAIARSQNYGVSARGLAIGSGDAGGEEFPRFSRFWIEKPDVMSSSISIYALLESPSVTGAYRIVATPGLATTISVRHVLFPRTEITNVGIAPLTSMFYFNPSDRGEVDDFRNAVHDSQGLQMINGKGERLWRPLANPQSLQISAFGDENPIGFGLTQRERSFAYYQDREARYDLRPSVWIEPESSWGEGAVQLVEIPVSNEFNDNIVAFWRPKNSLQPNQEYWYSYRIIWQGEPSDHGQARVKMTRTGLTPNDGARIYKIDFAGPIHAEGELAVDAAASSGKITNISVFNLPDSVDTRVALQFSPEGADIAELRVFLRDDKKSLSETWLYRWTAD